VAPPILAKAEQSLSVGYQKLLTFERPGGGLDWWGSGEPLVWRSAYGLQGLNDTAKSTRWAAASSSAPSAGC
jgi:hypothetical protein